MISIIIPVYNHALRLRECIEGVVNQIYRPIEVIIVNDGSTDDFATAAVEVEKLLREKGIVYKIINQTNLGGPSARNHGFRESSGEYVIFCDADVIAVPEMLSKMYEALQSNQEASYAYSWFRFGWKKFKVPSFDGVLLRKNNFVNTISLVRRCDLLEITTQNGPWDETLKRFQDWDLFLTLLKHNKTGVVVPEFLYRAQVSGRVGISSWLPSFVYRLPWKIERVKKYEAARAIVVKKHGLNN